jgi:membrane protease YdiL (CAAX protease family)
MKKYPSFYDILAIVGVFVSSSLIAGAVIGGALTLAGASREAMMAAVYPVPMICTAIFAVFYGRGRGEGAFSRPGFALPPREWVTVLGGMVLMLAVSVVLEPLLMLFPAGWFEWLAEQMGRGRWAFVTVVVMAPVLEELLFRGILQRSAVGAYGPAKGIMISAAVFGVIHFIPLQVINAFALGLVLGYVYYRTRSLTGVILMHAANNALSYLLTGIGPADATLREVLPSSGIYYAVYAACVLVVVLGTGVVRRDFMRNAN